jgi:hypothetical protein
MASTWFFIIYFITIEDDASIIVAEPYIKHIGYHRHWEGTLCTFSHLISFNIHNHPL